jgi:uncharacterized protein (TIGR03000 family)
MVTEGPLQSRGFVARDHTLFEEAYKMYKYAIAVFALLSSSALTPAWAGGHGCFGGGRLSVAGYGCWGGGVAFGFGCQGSGWYTAGMPVSYGCWGSGLPVSYGCWGGASFDSGWYPVGMPAGCGCYGGGLPVSYGWSGSCYGDIPAGYYSGEAGSYLPYDESDGISYATPVLQAGTVVPGGGTSGRPEPLHKPGPAGDPETRGTNRLVQERDRRAPEAGRGAAPTNRPPPADTSPGERIGAPEELANTPAPATIVVRVPADAALSINGVATRSTAATRTFVSPSLQPGKEFHYTLKAEAVRDGQKVAATQRIAVRAGERKEVVLKFGPAGGAGRDVGWSR